MIEQQQALIEHLEHRRAHVLRWLSALVGDADAEDVFQQALLTAWQQIHQLKDPNRVDAWFDQIARRRGLDFLRSQRVVSEYVEESVEEEEKKPCPCILQHIQELLPEQRAILWLTDVELLPVQKVAGAFSISPNSASMRLLRARRALRVAAEPCYGEHPYRDHDCACVH